MLFLLFCIDYLKFLPGYNEKYEDCYGILAIYNIFVPLFLCISFGKTVKEWDFFFYGEEIEKIENKIYDNFYVISVFFIMLQTSNTLQYECSIMKSTIGILLGFNFI